MSFLSRFSHLPFHTKVLLPVLAILVALPVVTVLLVDRHVEQQSLLEAEDKLSAAKAVLLNSLDIRNRAQQVQFRNVVNEPRFRAVSQLNDPDTLRAFLRDTLQEFDKGVEALLYTPIDGSASSGARRAPSFDLQGFETSVAKSVEYALGGDLNSKLSVYSNVAYNFLSVPVFLPTIGYPTGALTIAVRLDDSAIRDLKSLTHTELILALDSTLVSSTLPSHVAETALQDLQRPNGPPGLSKVRPILLANEHFHSLSGSLSEDPQADTPLRFVLLSSYEGALKALANTRLLLIAISLTGIAISVSFIYLHIRRITSPLRLLKEGADAVGRGDLSHRVECDSKDECGDLARAFNQMTGNLLASRRDLETTVAELRNAQGQLVEREQRLRESEEGLRLIIEGARDHAIFTIDDQGNALRWNSASERILGYTADEAKQLNYEQLFSEDREQAQTLLQTAREQGQASYEGWRVRADGSRFWADVTLSRLDKAEGSINGGFVEIARDITARKDAEVAMRQARDAAEASDRAKSEFLANMSHEFRTPMNGIIGMTGLLSSLELTEEQREYADTIRLSADSLLAIIDDILDIAKIEAGELEVSLDAINLVETLEESIQLLKGDAEAKSLELHLVCSNRVPASVLTDASRLRQVLLHLVGNAVKFTADGGVIVTVDYDAPAQELRVEVKDTGIGIPADKLDSLFDPFFQVQSSASRQFGGTGLGLTISRNIVKLLDGSIAVESELGAGSTFRLTLDAPAQDAERPFETFPQQRALLLVESPIAQQALQTQLGHWNIAVDCLASKPEPARKAIEQGNCQLLIIDSSAARTDTIRALFDCRKELGEAFPPVIRLVSSSAESELTRLERCAPLAKPLSLRALNRQLQTFRDTEGSSPKPQVTRQIPPTEAPAVTACPAEDTPAPAVSGETTLALPAPPSAADDAHFAESHPLRILVVEDNPINTKVLVKILKKLGYAPETAANGKEGLAAAESVEFDAILMDLQMPVMDGLECTRRIVSSEAIQHPVFISAFTANARDEDREACDVAGMQDFVPKPARIPAIKALLERAHHWVHSQRLPAS